MVQGTNKPPVLPSKAPVRKRKSGVWTVIGSLVVVVGVFIFFINVLPGPSSSVQYDDPNAKPKEPETYKPPPTTLVEAPRRVFADAITAIMQKDRKTLLKLSNIPGSPIDEILTDERAEAVGLAKRSNRFKLTDDSIKGSTARFAAEFYDNRMELIEELAFDMQQEGSSTENWKIVKVWNRWGPASKHPQEGGLAALEPGRKPIPYVPKEVPKAEQYPEADPFPVDFPTGTTDAVKAEVQKQMKALTDTQHPARSAEAWTELVKLGKPVIPAMLQKLASLNVRKEEEDREAVIYDRVLKALTGKEMGYPSEGLIVSVDVPPAEGKARAIRRWFGWWKANKDKPLVAPAAPSDVK